MKAIKIMKCCFALPIVMLFAGWYLTFLFIAAMPTFICQCFCLAIAQLFGRIPTRVIRDIIHDYVIEPVYEIMTSLYNDYK